MAKKYDSNYQRHGYGLDGGDKINVSGHTPNELLDREEAAQRAVAESDKWMLARRVNTHNFAESDSRKGLEALGFQVLQEADDLFYQVVPPTGWTKETDGYWTTVKDETGKDRISQFYKGAFYDRSAFLNFSN